MKSWVFVIAIFAAGTMSSVAFADDISTTREVGAASVGAAVAHRVISNRAAGEDVFLYFTEIRAKDDEKTLGYLVNKLKELRGGVERRSGRIGYYEKAIADYGKDLFQAKTKIAKYKAVKLLQRRVNPVLFAGAIVGAAFTTGEIASGNRLIEGTSNLLEKAKAPTRADALEKEGATRANRLD